MCSVSEEKFRSNYVVLIQLLYNNKGKQQNLYKNFILCKWKISLNELSSAFSENNHVKCAPSGTFHWWICQLRLTKSIVEKKINVHQWTIPTRYRSSNRPLSSLWLKINETSFDYFCWASKFLEKIKRIS